MARASIKGRPQRNHAGGIGAPEYDPERRLRGPGREAGQDEEQDRGAGQYHGDASPFKIIDPVGPKSERHEPRSAERRYPRVSLKHSVTKHDGTDQPERDHSAEHVWNHWTCHLDGL